MSDNDNQVYMDKQDIAISREVKRKFESSVFFEILQTIMNVEFDKYDIALPLSGYRGTPFIVMTGMNKENEEKHKFTTIGEAFKFAFEEYTTAVRLEALNAVTGNAYELVEETTE